MRGKLVHEVSSPPLHQPGPRFKSGVLIVPWHNL